MSAISFYSLLSSFSDQYNIQLKFLGVLEREWLTYRYVFCDFLTALALCKGSKTAIKEKHLVLLRVPRRWNHYLYRSGPCVLHNNKSRAPFSVAPSKKGDFRNGSSPFSETACCCYSSYYHYYSSVSVLSNGMERSFGLAWWKCQVQLTRED